MQFNNRPDQKNRRKYLRHNATPAEKLLWQYLRNRQLDGYKFRRQHSYGPYIMDFYCPELRLCIELDGKSHFTFEGMEKDDIRNEYLRQAQIDVLRIENHHVTVHPEAVLNTIKERMVGRKKRLG